MTKDEAIQLFERLCIPANEMTHVKGSFDKDIFIVDGSYILRPTEQGIDEQVACFHRIRHLPRVPKIVKTGTFEAGKTYNYLLLTQVPGVEYYSVIEGLNDRENDALGRAIAGFLAGLHRNSGQSYDIGHYIPIVKGHTGTWREGHEKYWSFLGENLAKITLTRRAQAVVNEAFDYLFAHREFLDYQTGPVLLHNDFHPKNIIVEDKAFSGVIDWECSQYGEADFDLCHLFHWCLFPPDEGRAFHAVLKAVLDASAPCATVPGLCERQTVYQIEQDLLQLMWSGGAAEAARIPRLEAWINDGIQSLVRALRVP